MFIRRYNELNALRNAMRNEGGIMEIYDEEIQEVEELIDNHIELWIEHIRSYEYQSSLGNSREENNENE